MNDILYRLIRKRRPQTQDDCVAIGVRQSLARLGALTDHVEICNACHGLAMGLFGPAWNEADLCQRLKWYKMTKHQYRIATNSLPNG